MNKHTQPLIRHEQLENGRRRGEIDHLVRSGRWTRMYNGLYIDSALKKTDKEDAERRAHLARCGDGAVLSHHSAAAVHGLDSTFDRTPGHWISVNHSRRVRLNESAHLSRSLTLKADEVEIVNGWPVTNRARTVLDLASLNLSDTELERIAESAMRSSDPRRPDNWREGVLDQLAKYATGDRRVRGSAAVDRILRVRGTGVRPTGSIAETAAIQALRGHGIVNVVRQPTLTIIGRDIKVYFPDILVDPFGLLVEVDGGDHAELKRRELDLARQNLMMLGFTIFRYPATTALYDGDRIARDIAAWVKRAERLGSSWTRGGVSVEGSGLHWTLRHDTRAA